MRRYGGSIFFFFTFARPDGAFAMSVVRLRRPLVWNVA